jgi:hypothetical protein
VAVIDEEDFDARCRRPIFTNSAATEDFRGCAGDPADVPFYTLDETADGKRTVSNELSCRVVEQHRARSGRVMINSADFGVNAPALKSLPRLRAPEGGVLASDLSDDGLKNPKLLAVDFPNPKGGSALAAQVYVGTSLYKSAAAADSASSLLHTDPGAADRPSVALVLNEPRAFGGDEDITLRYEAAFIPERKTGIPTLGVGKAESAIADADGAFCDRGVEDMDLARERGKNMGVAPGDLDAFAARHADYVQITQGIPDENSAYWTSPATASCGGATGKAAYFTCRDAFGPSDHPTALRDFRIVRAYQDHLVIEPRELASAEDKDEIINLLFCCFSKISALSYQVRASHEWVLMGSGSGFRHHVVAQGDDLRCVNDCNPRRALLDSRAFEISARDCKPTRNGNGCAIGPASADDVACVLDQTAPVTPGGPLDKCVFQSLTHRFAVYRGSEPTPRDTAFGWTVTGGFTPLVANLTSQSRAVSPQSLVFVPQIGQLAVADGASEGLVLVSLDSVSVSRLFF